MPNAARLEDHHATRADPARSRELTKWVDEARDLVRRSQRRLAAIMAADVVGYSRLMEADEVGTLATLKSRHRRILKPLVSAYRGRVFKLIGDCIFVEFASAVEAIICAVDLQAQMAEANAEQAAHRVMRLRIGINVGDVMVEGRDLYGDGVNIAARVQTLAEPGCVCVSAAVQDQIARRLPLTFEDLGEQVLKNITRSVRVYRVAARLPDDSSFVVSPRLPSHRAAERSSNLRSIA
jgi:class 3 adenylate cyclase